MRALATLLWHVPFLGFVSAFFMFALGGFFLLTIVGAPLGVGLIELGKFLLAPFGNRMTDASKLKTDLSRNAAWRVWGWIVMILWLPLGVVSAVVIAIQAVLCCVTIIGIPAGVAAARSLGTVLNPVGKKMVSADLERELAKRKASAQADAIVSQA